MPPPMGGGLYISKSGGGTAYLFSALQCNFTNNIVTNQGGAIHIADYGYLAGGDSTRFDDCVFSGNSAKDGGAIAIGQSAVYDDTLYFFNNNRFDGNSASNVGGAVLLTGGEPKVFFQNTNTFEGSTNNSDFDDTSRNLFEDNCANPTGLNWDGNQPPSIVEMSSISGC